MFTTSSSRRALEVQFLIEIRERKQLTAQPVERRAVDALDAGLDLAVLRGARVRAG